MINPFPIGRGQVLEIDTLSLTLDSCDFDPDGSLGLTGYRCQRIQDHWLTVKHSITGVPAITSRRHPARYEFEWNLLLTPEKFYLLEAIYNVQKQLVETFSEFPGVRVYDERKVHLEYTTPSRTRAKVGDVTNNPSPPPTGFTYIYPIWDVVLSEFQIEAFILPEDIYKVSLKGVELNAVPISEDTTSNF